MNLSGNQFKDLPPQIPWDLPNIERLTICRCSELMTLSTTENPSFCSRYLFCLRFCVQYTGTAQ